MGLAYHFCKPFFAQRLETQLSKLNLSDNLMKSPVVRKVSDATRGLKIRFNEAVKQDFVKLSDSIFLILRNKPHKQNPNLKKYEDRIT